MFKINNTDTLTDTNDRIDNLFKTSNNFSVVRIGNTEGYVLQCLSKKRQPVNEFLAYLFYTAGVFPVDYDFLQNEYARLNFEAMHNADLLGFLDISKEIIQDAEFVDSFKNSKFFFEDIYALDPGFLKSNNIVNVQPSNPWTLNLKGKKVLVVSAFKETILKQWEKRYNIWGKDTDVLLPFNLVDVVQSPFNPLVDQKLYSSNRNYFNIRTWVDATNAITKLMDSYNYDVALISAAAYSPVLANHAKQTGKIGLTVCGALQLFFGIKGPRWEQGALKEWSNLYNDYWTYPLDIDLPSNKQIFESLESAYWKQ